ncbi:hypothetical protein CF067_17520 [Clostridium sporogenes]|uniref:DNA polymerase III Alpha chain (DnaE) n=1 Tax=Clostridium botulinum B str. Osaka05 TaxID=1407017 RepID=A0A060N5V2_CLOBO|nr:hypothetical protein [Clostridium botulinum]BAO05237.1 DNA polymerase III Alpha chain (DnaE) [Clostridium botulinum B str. Osaka05]
MKNISVVDYDEESFGNNNDELLINNSFIIDNETGKYLTISEIKELQLFINPLDGNIFSIQNRLLKRNEKYYYESY